MSKLIGVLALLFMSLNSYGDGWSSGGGGVITDEFNPWFLGEDPIEYCVTIDPKFSIEKSRVQNLIKESFIEWDKFFDWYFPEGRYFPGTFSDGLARGITSQAIEVPVCLDKKNQIEFKIGIIDDEVNEYFNYNSKTKIAFAHRKNYDHLDFRNGGIIWISPEDLQKASVYIASKIEFNNGTNFKSKAYYQDITFPKWSADSIRLKSIILHEIGHVFGLPHSEDGVMSSHIYETIALSHIQKDSDGDPVLNPAPPIKQGILYREIGKISKHPEDNGYFYNIFVRNARYRAKPPQGFCELYLKKAPSTCEVSIHLQKNPAPVNGVYSPMAVFLSVVDLENERDQLILSVYSLPNSNSLSGINFYSQNFKSLVEFKDSWTQQWILPSANNLKSVYTNGKSFQGNNRFYDERFLRVDIDWSKLSVQLYMEEGPGKDSYYFIIDNFIRQ